MKSTVFFLLLLLNLTVYSQPITQNDSVSKPTINQSRHETDFLGFYHPRYIKYLDDKIFQLRQEALDYKALRDAWIGTYFITGTASLVASVFSIGDSEKNNTYLASGLLAYLLGVITINSRTYQEYSFEYMMREQEKQNKFSMSVGLDTVSVAYHF